MYFVILACLLIIQANAGIDSNSKMHFLENMLMKSLGKVPVETPTNTNDEEMSKLNALREKMLNIDLDGDNTMYAHCELVADATPDIKGSVEFRQKVGGLLEIRLNVTGLPTDDPDRDRNHGVHIHET